MAGGLIYGFAGSPAPVYACATVAYSMAVFLLSAIRVDIAPRRNAGGTGGRDPGRAPLHLAQQVDSRLHVAGSFCGAAGRRGGAAAGLRARDSAHRSVRTGSAARGSGLGRRYGCDSPGALSAAAAGRPQHAVLRRWIRRVHHRLRAVAQHCAVADCADADRRVRYGQRDCALHAGSAHDARRNARPRERGEYAVHRSVERSGPIRIGNHGAMVRRGSGGDIGRGGNHRDCAGVELAVSVAAAGR